jgi:predicted RNA-binding Zn-ribbon protein involved in translation (DUF1610 family)
MTSLLVVFLLLLCSMHYPLIDASTKATMVCSGSGSVLIEGKTIYYCPNESDILIFRCHVQNSNILLWKVSQSNKTIRIGAFTSVEEVKTEGHITVFLKEIQKNSDFSKNNFTSIMFLDTKDLVGPITTVTCETGDAEQLDSHYVISLDDDPSPFKDFSVSLDERSGSVIAYLEWDYPGTRSQIRGYQTVIRGETEVLHNRTLERYTNDTSCKLSSWNIYTASVQAISRCTGHHPVMETRIMDRSVEGMVYLMSSIELQLSSWVVSVAK